jgi:molybdopterin-guanine dinucleotide biosynthesis protein A
VISKEKNSAPLYGLVLAGGKSVRMGADKGLMQWHGSPQRYHLAALLQQFCADVFISCRPEQQGGMEGYNSLADDFDGAGPAVGILTAFKFRPQAAWLVAACDLPLLDANTISYLIAQRDTESIATTFRSPHYGLPEPLITIWEPASFEVLRAHIADGYSCPRKALLRNEARVKILNPPDAHALMNANTPEDAELVRNIIAASRGRSQG